ncbi:MAG TPA: hypothetical protein VE973_01130, partial [Candidatus Limnocylindria bacterium]|nr:hypothetical protein [Candidatus Limnocylindria bacterium]
LESLNNHSISALELALNSHTDLTLPVLGKVANMEVHPEVIGMIQDLHNAQEMEEKEKRARMLVQEAERIADAEGLL